MSAVTQDRHGSAAALSGDAGPSGATPGHACRSWNEGYDTLEDFAVRSDGDRGIAIDLLAPGTTLIVQTRHTRYRVVVLQDPHFVAVTGGTRFPAQTIVRYLGATAEGSALKIGWILPGFRMEMWLESVRITSSSVRSVWIDNLPGVCAGDSRPLA